MELSLNLFHHDPDFAAVWFICFTTDFSYLSKEWCFLHQSLGVECQQTVGNHFLISVWLSALWATGEILFDVQVNSWEFFCLWESIVLGCPTFNPLKLHCNVFSKYQNCRGFSGVSAIHSDKIWSALDLTQLSCPLPSLWQLLPGIWW